MSVTISSAIYWADWPYPSDTTFDVRAKSDKAWVADDMQLVPAGESRVVGTGTITALRPTLPAIALPATSAGLTDQTSRWTVTLHRTGRKQPVSTVLADFPLPSSFAPSTTWADILIHKNGHQPLRDTSVYMKTEVDTRIALAAGNLNFAGVGSLGRIETATIPTNPLHPKAVLDDDPRLAASSTSYASLAAAVTAIGATPTDLVITNAFPSGSSTTVPSTLRLVFQSGGSIVLGSGHTVIIRPDTWPIVQIFSGTGVVSFSGNSIAMVFPQWWGAVADRSGTTGTDSGPAIRAAVIALETAPSVGTLRLTGQFLANQTAANSQVVLVSKGIILEGIGSELSGIYWADTVPTTTVGIRYKPTAHPDNEGFTMRDFTIAAASCVSSGGTATYSCSAYSGHHAVLLDDSATSGNMAIRYVTIERCKILPAYAGGAAAGNYGIYATSTNPNGTPCQSVIDNNLVFNGMFLPSAGDTIQISNNTFMVFNSVAAAQVSGATTISFFHNNVTSRNGVGFGNATALFVVNNIIEAAEPDSAGNHGAMLDFDGLITQGIVEGNSIGVVGSAPPLDLARVANTNSVISFRDNLMPSVATKSSINQVGGTIILGNNNFDGAGTAITAAEPTKVRHEIMGYSTLPGSGGQTANLALVGHARFIGAAGVSPVVLIDQTDAAQTSGFFLNENEIKGYLLRYGSTFAPTPALRNRIELVNASTTGELAFGTNTTDRVIINSSGITNLFKGTNVASAATIAPTGNLFHVTGTTNIDNISTTGLLAGTRLTLIFDGILTVNDGTGNLKLAGNFTTSADDVLVVEFDGVAYYEVSRSVN